MASSHRHRLRAAVVGRPQHRQLHVLLLHCHNRGMSFHLPSLGGCTCPKRGRARLFRTHTHTYTPSLTPSCLTGLHPPVRLVTTSVPKDKEQGGEALSLGFLLLTEQETIQLLDMHANRKGHHYRCRRENGGESNAPLERVLVLVGVGTWCASSAAAPPPPPHRFPSRVEHSQAAEEI